MDLAGPCRLLGEKRQEKGMIRSRRFRQQTKQKEAGFPEEDGPEREAGLEVEGP